MVTCKLFSINHSILSYKCLRAGELFIASVQIDQLDEVEYNSFYMHILGKKTVIFYCKA